MAELMLPALVGLLVGRRVLGVCELALPKQLESGKALQIRAARTATQFAARCGFRFVATITRRSTSRLDTAIPGTRREKCEITLRRGVFTTNRARLPKSFNWIPL